MLNRFVEDPEFRRRIVERLSHESIPRIKRLTAPLFAPDKRGLLGQVASGIILELASDRLLVTASHVVKAWPGLAVNVWDEFMRVRGSQVRVRSPSTDPGSDSDRLDVTVFRLERSVADRINGDYVMNMADLDLSSPVVGRNHFVLYGYPAKRNANGLHGDEFTARAYGLLLRDANSAFYSAIGAVPQAQLVLPFEREDTWTIERRVNAPDLSGVSGGGLWRVPIREGDSGETRLSAIAVGQHPKGQHRYVLSTRIAVVLQAIHRHHPDLRSAIEHGFGVEQPG